MKLKYSDLHLKTKRALSNKFFKNHNITYDSIDPNTLFSLNNILEKNITVDRRQSLFEMLISSTLLESDLEKRFEQYLNAKIHTLEFYRLKFGDEEGKKRYNQVCQSRGEGNTLEGQIQKYGTEEGTKRHKKMNLLRAHTLENFIRKHGEKKGKEMYELTMSKKGLTLKRFQNKYGNKIGKEKWKEWKEKCVSTEENFIRRHGETLGKQKWQEFKEKCSCSQENFIKKYGKEEGTKKYKQFCKRSANTKENFIRTYGLEEGTQRWKKYKNSNAGYKASKESLEFFEYVTIHLLRKGFDFDDIFYGVKNSFEYKIEDGKKLHSYDYTILSLKIIFEYNGSHVHPSKEKLTESEWNDWKAAWSGLTADEKYEIDQNKIRIAENQGFTVMEIWDYENSEESLEKCIKLINEKI